MKKAGIVGLLMLLMLGISTSPVRAAIPTVILDGATMQFDVAPVNENGRILVPLRTIFESLGARLTWDPATKTASAVKGSNQISLTVGGQSSKNGEPVVLDVPARLVNDRVLVPLRFVSEALGATVNWNSRTQMVTIISAVDSPVPALNPADTNGSPPAAETPAAETAEPASQLVNTDPPPLYELSKKIEREMVRGTIFNGYVLESSQVEDTIYVVLQNPNPLSQDFWLQVSPETRRTFLLSIVGQLHQWYPNTDIRVMVYGVEEYDTWQLKTGEKVLDYDLSKGYHVVRSYRQGVAKYEKDLSYITVTVEPEE